MLSTAPALSWPVVLAVLCGAALHAGWNALVKSSDDKPLDTALVHLLGAVVALPLLAIVGLPGPAGLPCIAASLVIHMATTSPWLAPTSMATWG